MCSYSHIALFYLEIYLLDGWAFSQVISQNRVFFH
jgi:hypothetical protein